MQKKLALITAIMINSIGIANAENNTTPSSCALISINGQGSYFLSADKHLNTTLWHAVGHGDGISGGVTMIQNATSNNAPIIDSHCNSGNVELNWNQNDFSGHLVGTLVIKDNKPYSLSNVTGTINGEPFSQDLYFITYK
jgi:hypothetical protein